MTRDEMVKIYQQAGLSANPAIVNIAIDAWTDAMDGAGKVTDDSQLTATHAELFAASVSLALDQKGINAAAVKWFAARGIK